MLQIGAALFYYKLGQRLLQIGAASSLQIGQLVIKIEAAIPNKGNGYYKIGQLLQTGTKCITKWGRYYKLRQFLQVEA